MGYRKPKLFFYRLTQAVAWVVATFVFRRKFLRNEIKGKKGPYVVIANHQAALDFVNLIGATGRPLTFVISHSFYNSLPVQGIMDQIGVIPKQQFQTSTADLKRMKEVIDRGEAFVIYPAGLMCEDGLSTPIPAATYKFLKWLKADVYMARTSGSYFVMPKWGKGMRPGRTTMDIYRLFSKEELQQLDIPAIRERTDRALLFDAYREQEQLRYPYLGAQKLEGMEQVLYLCPHCKGEFTVRARKDTLYCTQCGFAHQGDAYGFLHNRGTTQRELRYISDWSREIYRETVRRLDSGAQGELSAQTEIHILQGKRFRPMGTGTLTLNAERFSLTGTVAGQPLSLSVEAGTFPSLPFSPGKYLEFQDGSKIYRCVLSDGRLVMKFINLLKVFYARKWDTAREPQHI